MHILIELKNRIVPYVFPVFCLGCKQEGEIACNACMAQLYEEFVAPQWLSIRGMDVYVCGTYVKESLFAKLLHAYKYGFSVEAGTCLASLISVANDRLPCIGLASVVPMPIHRRRVAARGYNQSQRFAEAICTATGAKVVSALKRCDYQKRRQSERSREERLDSEIDILQKATPLFPCAIVDDVITTGTTMVAAVDALKQNTPPADVIGWCVAYKD